MLLVLNQVSIIVLLAYEKRYNASITLASIKNVSTVYASISLVIGSNMEMGVKIVLPSVLIVVVG